MAGRARAGRQAGRRRARVSFLHVLRTGSRPKPHPRFKGDFPLKKPEFGVGLPISDASMKGNPPLVNPLPWLLTPDVVADGQE